MSNIKDSFQYSFPDEQRDEAVILWPGVYDDRLGAHAIVLVKNVNEDTIHMHKHEFNKRHLFPNADRINGNPFVDVTTELYHAMITTADSKISAREAIEIVGEPGEFLLERIY